MAAGEEEESAINWLGDTQEEHTDRSTDRERCWAAGGKEGETMNKDDARGEDNKRRHRREIRGPPRRGYIRREKGKWRAGQFFWLSLVVVDR